MSPARKPSARKTRRTGEWVPSEVQDIPLANETERANGGHADSQVRSSALGEAEDDLLAVVERRIAEVKGELRAQIELLETEIRDAKKPSAGKLSVNQVTFEELREMGLTATQSARLIGARETKGGFRNLDELDKLTGISKRALGELKARVKL